MDDARARAIITRRLQPGERLIWHDRPSPWHTVGKPLLFLGFMIVLTGHFVIVSGATTRPSGSVGLDDFIFGCVLAVFWFLLARLVVNRWRTAYGLTDQRAIIAVGDNGPTQSFGAAAFARVKRRSGKRRGTLLFDWGRTSRATRAGTVEYDDFRSGFYGIRAPARVEALIQEHLLSGPARREPDGANIETRS